MSEWKPGDVAMVTGRWVWSAPHSPALARRRKAGGWMRLSDTKVIEDYETSVANPLVLIDPEDREQVERLTTLHLGCYGVREGAKPEAVEVHHMQAALREFANPTPPKPDEPLGLGAVVEDSDGTDWHRTSEGRWIAVEGLRSRASGWTQLDVVRVLSEGVTP